MTLLVTICAAIASTIIWYLSRSGRELKLGFLCLMYWGAAIMWTVDSIFEYAELGVGFFNPAPAELLNDLFLGLSAVALGLIIWLAVLLISDPRGRIKAALVKKVE